MTFEVRDNTDQSIKHLDRVNMEDLVRQAASMLGWVCQEPSRHPPQNFTVWR